MLYFYIFDIELLIDRYFETSYHADSLNAGGTMEGSLIFSESSYLPRSANLNLSLNVFGENLNLFEVGARAEGFEELVEDIFGPDGYFREDTLHKVLVGLRRDKRQAYEEGGSLQTSPAASFQQSFNELRPSSPRGRWRLRMFDKDVRYGGFDGLEQLRRSLGALGAAGEDIGDVRFSRSSVFLDGGIVLPTAAGLPLTVAVNGTYNVELK